MTKTGRVLKHIKGKRYVLMWVLEEDVYDETLHLIETHDFFYASSRAEVRA